MKEVVQNKCRDADKRGSKSKVLVAPLTFSAKYNSQY